MITLPSPRPLDCHLGDQDSEHVRGLGSVPGTTEAPAVAPQADLMGLEASPCGSQAKAETLPMTHLSLASGGWPVPLSLGPGTEHKLTCQDWFFLGNTIMTHLKIVS